MSTGGQASAEEALANGEIVAVRDPEDPCKVMYRNVEITLEDSKRMTKEKKLSREVGDLFQNDKSAGALEDRK